MDTTRRHAEQLDATDPLAALRERFVVVEPGLRYLDGNSLGRLPKATVDRLRAGVEREWGAELVRGWAHWVDDPLRVGDLLGSTLLGAAPGQVAVVDSTTVNLYKLAMAAVDARPTRRVVVTDDDNFPTDRYVLQGIAQARGLTLRLVTTDPDEGLDPTAVAAAVDEDTALVSFSHVAYRSGALADLAGITALAHAAGALTLWDLAHSVGAVPVDLDTSGADLAVGCTYKYLNAGPGAPAFLYVRRELQDRLTQPIWGWFGQADQFAMGPDYQPAAGIRRFATGTPPVLGIAAVEEGVRLLADAGLDRLRAKGSALTDYLIGLADALLAEHGVHLASPREASRRGAHVSMTHPEAWRITQALIHEHDVVPDYRAPDRIRWGPAPLATRFVDVWAALTATRTVLGERTYERYPAEPSAVT